MLPVLLIAKLRRWRSCSRGTREGGKVHSYTIAEFTFSWKRDIKSNSHNVDSQQQPQRYQQQTQQHK